MTLNHNMVNYNVLTLKIESNSGLSTGIITVLCQQLRLGLLSCTSLWQHILKWMFWYQYHVIIIQLILQSENQKFKQK